ncbi:aminotransferase class I/II-fold pyridoxal phosphate-dependent enzyme [Microbacterium limosum]|uniref:cysteine-S-conjugate beta-lyase n=1 Tax=Microbacterium limosum TaxID=3079935 RepID=A0AAU0MGZ6_9MICO|nr:aminotransferase class I/II-fold pyridoxal phosphate-dependent enzyme [Microbacterium sp. Y20]WOQ69259.1 aminotransferase class I/II-fold pyridoxal phosphate-dependent enzyme [Microbacterium sp. Y20]
MARADFSRITEADLREAGSLKWTMFPDTIGAFVAEMDFGVAPAVADALKEAVDRGETGYLTPKRGAQLATAASRWYSTSYGWDVPPERVHHIPDVIAAFELAIEKFTPAGSPVIVPTPAYMPFLFVPQLRGREVIQIPGVLVDGRMGMDLDAIGRAFDDGAGMLVLCNPHNPLGTVFTRAELEAVAALVEAKGGRVFSDEIHAPLVYAPARHIPYASVSPAAAGHTITAASASKAWNLAGLKCAQLILSNDEDAAAWEKLGMRAGVGTSTLGVIANIAAYEHGRGWLEEVTAYLDENRRTLVADLAAAAPLARVTVPEGTYIALIDFRAYGLEGDLGAWFREHARVAMTDGAACGEAAAGHCRFVFAMPRPLLREAVARIGAALEALSSRPIPAAEG